MREEIIKGFPVLTLYDRSKWPTKTVSNDQVLIISKSGHGKSLAAEMIIEAMHELGYLIIVVTEKPGAPLEIGFANFKPTYQYHLDLLKDQQKTPKEVPIKIYHPMTFNIPTMKDMPPIELFTIPIKSINMQEITVLLEVEEKNRAAIILNNAISKLGPEDNVYDLLWRAERSISSAGKRIEGGITLPHFDEDFHVKGSEAGSKTNIDEILSSFRPFLKDYCLSNDKGPFNLNWKELLSDQKHYHIFTNCFLEQRKTKYFIVNWLLNQIDRYKEQKKHPILIYVPEAKVFLPVRSKDVYVQKTANNFEEKLSTMRSSGISSIAESQGFFDLAEGYRGSVTELFFGALNTEDMERISKVYRIPIHVRERLNKLPRNHYYRIESWREWPMIFPSHAHKEEGQNFFTEYRKNHPEQMRNYKELIKTLKNFKKDEETKAMERATKITKRMIELAEQRKMEETQTRLAGKEESSKKEELRAAADNISEEKKVLIYRQSKLNQDNVKAPSWSKLGSQYGISDHTAKKYANEGQTILQKRLLGTGTQANNKPVNGRGRKERKHIDAFEENSENEDTPIPENQEEENIN